jgi:hypothetical protein
MPNAVVKSRWRAQQQQTSPRPGPSLPASPLPPALAPRTCAMSKIKMSSATPRHIQQGKRCKPRTPPAADNGRAWSTCDWRSLDGSAVCLHNTDSYATDRAILQVSVCWRARKKKGQGLWEQIGSEDNLHRISGMLVSLQGEKPRVRDQQQRGECFFHSTRAQLGWIVRKCIHREKKLTIFQIHLEGALSQTISILL